MGQKEINMKILINESQLKILIEQQSPQNKSGYQVTATNNKVISRVTQKFDPTCVPSEFKGFVMSVVGNQDKLSKELGIDTKTLLFFTKLSLGIMYRETKLGAASEYLDDAAEAWRRIGFGTAIDFVISAKNKITGSNTTQSLGYGQFTPETWAKYGLDKKVGDYNSSFSAAKQGMAVLYLLTENYKKAIAAGLKNEPSVNPILQKYGVITKIDGSGSHAIDMSILSHNMPIEKTLTKYCTTSHPLYYAPCNLSEYSPYKSKESFNPNNSLLKKVNDPKLKQFPGLLKVNGGNVINNYFPNLKGPGHTGIGYVEEVIKNSKTYNCF